MSEVDELLAKEKQGYSDKKSKKKAKKPTWAATIAILLALPAGFISWFFLIGPQLFDRSGEKSIFDYGVGFLDSFRTGLIITSVLSILSLVFVIIAISKKQALGACALTIAILMISAYAVFSGLSTCKKFEKAIDHDEKLGADRIDDAVELYIDALRHQDVDDLEDILEENLMIRKNSHPIRINEDAFMDLADALNEQNLNWSHCEYEVIDRYDDEDGCDCRMVMITIPYNGMITEDAIMSAPLEHTVSFHEVNDRWFLFDHND